MSYSQQITFVDKIESRSSFVIEDRWQFKPRGRAQFLQRWAWSFLMRMGALRNAIGETVTYTRHMIDTADVMRRLIEQHRAALRLDMGDPEVLLIGSEDFAQLMGAPEIRRMLSFATEYHRGPRVMGLQVKVIPWMKGMLVMPKER